jgi:hypothetical protein
MRERENWSLKMIKKLVLATLLVLNFTQIAQAQWKHLYKEDEIHIYGKDKNADGIIPFKAHAYIEHNIETVYRALRDFDNKTTWAPKLYEVKIHKVINNDEYIFSEYYSTPWPAVDREFLLHGKVIRTDEGITLLAKSVRNRDYKNSDLIQAKVSYLNISLKKVDDGLTQIVFEFSGDMRGWMPTWLINLIQKKWPLRFIQGLRKYLATTNINLIQN